MKRAKLLVIDEVSMGHKHVFEALDRTLRYVRGCEDKLFGGLNILFAADWRQCLPVIPKGSRGQIANACLKSSYIWEHVQQYRLSTNMRVQLNRGDIAFAEYLDRCGDGKLPTLDGKYQVQVSLKNCFLQK